MPELSRTTAYVGFPRFFCGLSPDELVHVEDRRQEEVPDDHERGQTQGNDYTSESVTWPDRRPNDHRRRQADRKPGCRKLHVTEHEVTLAHPISLRTAAAPDRYTDNARPPHPAKPRQRRQCSGTWAS
jgi:hypothetical protein